ncbi:MAG: alpha/beta hydrolase [Ignavibacteria bacterium]|nr:alpha/beta hydrolase [Ignavibacteria bacterium]
MKINFTQYDQKTSLIIFIVFLFTLFTFNIVVPFHLSALADSGITGDEPVDNCYDLSNHTVKFITTEPGVSLEVLDWGGTGEYLVLLTGLGDNAHVFDNFAYQFTDLYHVIGITRRGFGKSSKPEDGYSEEIRVRDYTSILDQLNIPKATFIGHSIAGGELNYIGSHYQDRVSKLVYLDGWDFGEHKLLAQPPSLDFADSDLASLNSFMAALVRYNGYREPNAAICDTYTWDSDGKISATISPPEVSQKIVSSSVVTDYSLITAPVLGIFETWTMDTRLPFYHYLDAEKKTEYDKAWDILFDWRARQMTRFKTEIKNSRTVEFAECYHYVYINREADCAREIRKFLAE